MENNYKKFDKYGLHYLPSHLIAYQSWDDVARVLCDLQFIEAKSAIGLAFELVSDYTAALSGLSRESEKPYQWVENQDAVELYVENLMAFAKGKTQSLNPIPSVAHSIEEKAENVVKKEPVNPQDIGYQVKAFGQFVNEHVYYLEQFSCISGFCAQQAYNAYLDGPVGESAQQYINSINSFDSKSGLILNLDSDRRPYTTLPAPFRPMMGHAGEVYGVALTPDGKIAISGGADAVVRVWNVERGQCKMELLGHSARVHSVAISADGKMAVSGSFDETLRVWKLSEDQGQCLHVLKNHAKSVDAVALSADGRIAASGGRDYSVRIWNTSTGEQIHKCRGHKGNVVALAMSANGKVVVSKGADYAYRIWDTEKGACIEKLLLSSDYLSSPILSPDGHQLVFAIGDKIKVWDLENKRYLKTFQGHSESVRYISISADGRRGVSTGMEKAIRLWDFENGKCLRIMHGLPVYPHGLAMSADARIAISSGDDGSVLVWDLLGKISTQGKKEINLSSSRVPSIDGKIQVSGKYGHFFKVWTNESEAKWKIDTLEDVNALALSADGQRVVTGHRSGVLQVWNTQTGEKAVDLTGHGAGIATVAMSADGRFTISASWDDTIRFWDTVSRSCLLQIPIENAAKEVAAMVLSADGSIVLTGGIDKIVKVWDTASGKLLCQFKGHTGTITAIALSLDATLAFSASMDKTLRVWKIKTGKCIAVKGFGSSIEQVSIINDIIRTVDTSYDVNHHVLKNYSLPNTNQIEHILRILSTRNFPSPFEAQIPDKKNISKVYKSKRSYSGSRYCSECGYRVALDTAKNRGLTDMGNYDGGMMVWCYFYNQPVNPHYHMNCSQWLSYKELDYDSNPQK